ncbi:hypothetical protein AB0H18_44665 [Streptomyces sp. NPDC020766]
MTVELNRTIVAAVCDIGGGSAGPVGCWSAAVGQWLLANGR